MILISTPVSVYIDQLTVRRSAPETMPSRVKDVHGHTGDSHIDRQSAIDTMNTYGAHRVPFVFFIDFAMVRTIVMRVDDPNDHGILYDFDGRRNCPLPVPATQPCLFVPHPVSARQYGRAFDRVQKELAEGNSYLVNLTFPTPVECSLSLEEIFKSCNAKYRALLPNHFVVFSPETFVRIRDGVISSFPMKGTIEAAVPDAATKVLADQKELAEHITIVDLIRNDLSIVARDVRVERFRYLEAVRTNRKELLQVSSEICGTLPEGYSNCIGTILFHLLPAGSVTGAPKKKTVEIINAVEKGDRGYYTGVCGYSNGDELESCVMIRFIEQESGGLLYRSGGGITALSDPEKEYNEMVDKVYVPLV